MTPDILVGELETRLFQASFVNFGPGASILSIKHPSDYSAIHASCNKQQRSAGDFQNHLYALFREPVGLSRIRVITDPDTFPVIAHVQVEDPNFAARIKNKFDRLLKCVPQTTIAISIVSVEIDYEASVNPPDMMPIRRYLLQDRHARLRLKESLTFPEECAVCLTEAEDPYFTACGHLYCRACFGSQCYSVCEGKIPIRCLGNSGKCSRIFLLSELKLILQSEIFDQLLNKAFSIYLKTIKTIQECPTSHCQHTYRTSTDGSVLTCFKCSTPICTTCQAPSHSGMTCAMYQRIGTADYQTWSSNKNIRKCPRCKNLIEKTGGCEKVDCICGAGMCWICMELWDENRQCHCIRTV